MTQKHVQLLVLAAFLCVATCISVDKQLETKKLNRNILIPRIDDSENEKLENKNFSYIAKTKRNIPCILAKMSISIAVPYKTNEGKEIIKELPVPLDASTDGSNCADVISQLKLTWKEKGDDKNENNVITFIFLNDHTNFTLFSVNTSIYLDEEKFPNATPDTKKRVEYTSEKDLRLFVAPVQNGYHRCIKKISQTVGKHELLISDVTLIAFNSAEDISSRKEATCPDEKEKIKTFPYVLKKDEKYCSLARMSISLNISYATKDSKVQYGTKIVPSYADVSGVCGDSFSQMFLTWPEKNEIVSTFDSNTKGNEIIFRFMKNNRIASVDAIGFDIILDEKNFPNNIGERITGQTPLTFDPIFSTSADNGLYSCANVTTVNFQNAIMNISDVLLVAFNAEQDFSLKTVEDCKSQFALYKENFSYYVLTEDTDVACILANMTIAMEIPYTKTDSTVVNGSIVPQNVTATGTCKTSLSELNLAWPVPNNQGKMNTITFYVVQKENHFSVLLIDTDIYLDEVNFPGARDQNKKISKVSELNIDLFNAPANGLYNCTNVHRIKMDDSEMNITNVVFVAFNTEEDVSKKIVQDCNRTDNSSTTAPTVPTDPTNPTDPTTESTISDQPTTKPSTNPPPKPEPDPSVKAFDYYVMNQESTVACTMANMTISLKVPYEMKTSGIKTTNLDMPHDVKVNGKCDDASSTIEFIWKSTEDTSDTIATENVVTLTFKKDDSKFFVRAINVSLYMDEKNFPDAKQAKQRHEALAKEVTLFSTPLKQLFKCTPQTQVKAVDVEVTISKVALIAFNTESKVLWKSVQNCVTEEAESDVGAIVGGIIGCFILIGLIAFGIIMYRKRRRMV
ncbi:uncharacterized protein LOC117600043 [Osmia lignaria lignaria]|uniref:uncharacterized protein LOC117600043 n=1 Tax=Osmia lignaria lignaria TaxID=1437193 RepID=UPI00402B7351